MKLVSVSLALLAATPAHGFYTMSSALRPPTARVPRCGVTQRQLLGHHNQRASTLLTMTDGNNFSKKLAAVFLASVTLGASTIPFFFLGPESNGPKTVRVMDEDGSVSERGALTAMTREEIQKKLAQIPVFFLRDESGSVYVEGGEGLFFMSPEDAKAKLEDLKSADGQKVRVAATTLDDVWFPLLKKKGLNKKPVAAQASMLSNMSARYRLVPRSNQITQAIETAGWNTVTVGDKDGVPVWAADTLAFKGTGTGSKYKMPLFTNVDDLMTSWERLKTEAGSATKSPTIQVSSIGTIIDIMERGGANNRDLEFFADMDAIEKAEELSL
ncbi:unnamed protein product [Ascophyllum nodosum]